MDGLGASTAPIWISSLSRQGPSWSETPAPKMGLSAHRTPLAISVRASIPGGRAALPPREHGTPPEGGRGTGSSARERRALATFARRLIGLDPPHSEDGTACVVPGSKRRRVHTPRMEIRKGRHSTPPSVQNHHLHNKSPRQRPFLCKAEVRTCTNKRVMM